MSYSASGKRRTTRTWRRPEFDAALASWFASAADGDQVEVVADLNGDGKVLRVRMAHPPAVAAPVPAEPSRTWQSRTQPQPDAVRLAALARFGGGVNPYTFIPALPRAALPPELGDGPPALHGVIDPSAQWSGWLVLKLTTRTPLLLPDPEHVHHDGDDHPTYPVRVGADGMPLLHGASVKGALRSAYEIVTGSRYGVFRGHGTALAYRRPAGRVVVTPARVESDGRGGLRFRLCQRPALPVPLYDGPGHAHPRRKARAVGTAAALITGPDGTRDWEKLHGEAVWYTTREAGRPGKTRTFVDEVTLASDRRPPGAKGPGWLSITRRSIQNKVSERLFVPGDRHIAIEEHHHALWHAVLASYRDAAEHNGPGEDAAGHKLARSRHVIEEGEVPRRLTEGDLVYLDITEPETPRASTRGRHRPPSDAPAVTAVHPVMIGRLPFGEPPGSLLHESLHPAAELKDLSPADRLFGWAPQESSPGRRSTSGYRGKLRIESVRCSTADWLVNHGERGVALGPLSSPKPTQFRFYAASDQSGTPMPQGVSKADGYRAGLRGRKAYWYPNPAPDGYWVPGTGQLHGGRLREWQEPPDANRSQNSSHRGWVREGAEFTVRLFLDAVPGAELGPLLWLLTQDGCPLRLGAAKPYGFGAVEVSIDWPATELRTGESLRGCWLSLTRPDPSLRADAEALAEAFGELAAHPVLAPAIAAWQAVSKGIADPIHYPRTQADPEAETYRWFDANEQIKHGVTRYGIALPHVLEENQQLPLLPSGLNP
jgi:CRISPR-associated protein (TIGR03986 family)